MKLWLDDVRPAPEGWEWAMDAEAAIFHLAIAVGLADPIEEVSLDHDLGADPSQGIYARGNSEACGCRVANYIAAEHVPILRPIRIHSWNPVEARKMAAMLNEAGYDVEIRPFRPTTPLSL